MGINPQQRKKDAKQKKKKEKEQLLCLMFWSEDETDPKRFRQEGEEEGGWAEVQADDGITTRYHPLRIT